MQTHKHAVHLTFKYLADKRRFCSILNKFRRAGYMTIIDLGKDENGVSVEFAFAEKEQMLQFEQVVRENAESMNIYRS